MGQERFKSDESRGRENVFYVFGCSTRKLRHGSSI